MKHPEDQYERVESPARDVCLPPRTKSTDDARQLSEIRRAVTRAGIIVSSGGVVTNRQGTGTELMRQNDVAG